MRKCEWCNRPTDKQHKVMSLGTQYNICSKCKEAFDNEECIKCGEIVAGAGSIKGLCYGCSQASYEESQRKAEEVANGVDVELMEFYSSGVEFTEEDYEHWVTFGQGNFSPEGMRKRRREGLRKKLLTSGWEASLIDANMDSVEKLMEKHISKMLDKRYIIVYYDGTSKTKKVRQFIDRVGNIFLVAKK